MGEITWLFTEEPINDEIVSKVERSLNVKFPEDYKECVLEYNGGYPKPNVFKFENSEGEAVFNDLLSFTGDYSLEAVYESSKSYLPADIIPFARDPFGNLICFDYRKEDNQPTLVFVDHEVQGEDPTYPICNTFTELLDKLFSLEEE